MSRVDAPIIARLVAVATLALGVAWTHAALSPPGEPARSVRVACGDASCMPSYCPAPASHEMAGYAIPCDPREDPVRG